MTLRCLLFLALAGICGVVPTARAAESLRLEAAIARALASHPTLAAEQANTRATEARAQREGLPTPYVAGGELENFAGTGELSGFGSAEATLRLGRVLELGGKRDARLALGAAEVERQRQRLDATRVDVRARTTTRFVEVLAAQQRVVYAREHAAQSARTRREVARWVAAARNPETDLHAADIAGAQAELELEHAEHELASARTALATAWGARTPDFDRVDGDLGALPELSTLEALQARLASARPEQAAELEAAEVRARRRVAESAAHPDISVSAGLRRVESLGDQGLVMAVSVPLGSRLRSRLAVAEADAQLDALAARRQAQLLEAHGTLFEGYQELLHARTELESLRKRMLPKAEQAVAFARRGFEAGRFSFLALSQAQATLFALRARVVDATVRAHLLQVEIDRLTAACAQACPGNPTP